MNNINEIIRGRIDTFGRVLQELPEVRYVGDPVLREQTIKATTSEGIAIGNQLGKILLKYRDIAGFGRGLAAPQIGINKAIFVTFVDGKLQTFINPTITGRSKTTNFYKEFCLSSGIIAADIERPEWVVMSWVDVEGIPQEQKFDDFWARLIQHEEDHLRGVVNLDVAHPGGIELVTFDPLKEELRTTR